MTRRQILALSVLTLLSALPAYGQTQGVLIKGKHTRGARSEVMEIRLDKNRFHTDVNAGGERFQEIFDGTKPLFVTLSLNRKTYRETSRAERLDQLITALRQMMPNPTTEQQARIDEALRPRNTVNNDVPPVREYFPFSKEKVGDWPCTNYSPPGGAIICVADAGLFGLTPEDFDVVRRLEQFELTLELVPGPGSAGRGFSISPVGELFVSGISEGKPFAGIVIKRTLSLNPVVASTFEITEIRREPLPPDLFEIPAGFNKESIPVPAIPVRAPR